MRRSLTVGALTLALLGFGIAPAAAEPGPKPPRPTNSGCHLIADGSTTGDCASSTNRGVGRGDNPND